MALIGVRVGWGGLNIVNPLSKGKGEGKVKGFFRDRPAVGGKNRPDGRKQRVYVWVTKEDGLVYFRRAW